MKIKYEHKTLKMVELDDVEGGGVFKLPESDILYIKILSLKDSTDSLVTAVELNDGDHYYFELDREVVPVNCFLQVGGNHG